MQSGFFAILLVFFPHAVALTYPMVESLQERNMKFTHKHNSYSTTSEKMISRTCNESLVNVANNSNLLTRYADAAGKPGGGIFLGNVAWLGSYSECKTIPATHYCLASFKITPTNITQIPVSMGLCVPEVCSETDVLYGLEDIIKSFDLDKYISVVKSQQMSVGTGILSKAVSCAKPSEYTAGVIVTLSLCGIILTLCLFGTITEVILSYTKPSANKSSSFMPIKNTTVTSDETFHSPAAVNERGTGRDSDTAHLVGSEALPVLIHDKEKNIALEILLCFSLLRNTNQIMDTKVPAGAITSLNGMRVVSMWWVILGHTFAWLAISGVVSNMAEILTLLQRFTFQTIENATFSVDSFFFLSGLLVCYLSLRQMTKLDGRLPLFKFYFHRFWRLTPSYMFVILFYDKLNGFFGEGPLWAVQQQNPACDKYWWTNLLYINNFYPTSFQEGCLDWSWYLANDMQFYVISPIILYATFRYKSVGFGVSGGTLLVASFISTASIIAYYNLAVDLLGGGENRGGGLRQPTKDDFTSLVYVKPYCRIAPYLVGMALGFLIHIKPKQLARGLHPILVLLGWVVAIVLALSTLYGQYGAFKEGGTPFNRAENVIYGTFSRFTWGLALAWVIFVCHSGYGGLVNKILSASYWIPLSRLTYSAYLVHPIVLGVFFGSFETNLAYSDVHIVFYFCGVLVVSYAVAFILAVGVEFPMMQLEKIVFKSRERDR